MRVSDHPMNRPGEGAAFGVRDGTLEWLRGRWATSGTARRLPAAQRDRSLGARAARPSGTVVRCRPRPSRQAGSRSASQGDNYEASICDAVGMSSSNVAPPRRIIRLVGVYDAESSLRGELAYWIGARLGRRHCALCEITHGSVRERPEWKACRDGLPVPFDNHHRDDQPTAVRIATGGITPVVVAETDSAPVIVLSPADLEACAGSIDRLVEAIERAAARLDLTWTTP